MFRKETVAYAMRQLSYRRRNPTRGDKRLILLLAFVTGCLVFFVFAFLVSGSPLFAWLYDAAVVTILVIVVIGLVRWFYDIMKHKEQNVL